MKGKGALLMGAAILAAAPAWATWTAFGEEDTKATWYVDAESVRATGSMRQVWALKDMEQPVIDFDLSARSGCEINCQARRCWLLQFQDVRGHMGSGEPRALG